MKIVGIVAVGPQLEIGAAGKLLYPSKTDMAFFCGFTQGKLLIMGRKTAETIPSVLPGREVLCVSKDAERAKQSPCVSAVWNGVDFQEVIDYANGRDIVIVGGGEIYRMFSGMYHEFYVTVNRKEYHGSYGPADTFFDESCLQQLPNIERIFTDATAMFDVIKYS